MDKTVDSAATAIDRDIIDDLEQVRDSGEVNMLDRRGVMRVASALGLYGLVVWLDDCTSSRTYTDALRQMGPA